MNPFKIAALILLTASFLVSVSAGGVPFLEYVIHPWHVFLLIIAALVLMGAGARTPIAAGIILFFACPVDPRYALYAFYFLVFGVVLIFVALLRSYVLAEGRDGE